MPASVGRRQMRQQMMTGSEGFRQLQPWGRPPRHRSWSSEGQAGQAGQGQPGISAWEGRSPVAPPEAACQGTAQLSLQ